MYKRCVKKIYNKMKDFIEEWQKLDYLTDIY